MGRDESAIDLESSRAVGMEPGRPTRVRYQVLATACILALLAYIHRVGFATAGTYLKKDLGLTSGDWGNVMAAFLIAYAGFEIPCGLLGDRLGVRHLLTIAVLGWSVLTGAVTLVLWLPAVAGLRLAYLLAIRFFFGMFQAAIFPSLSRMMGDWMPIQERASAQGFIWMCSRLGGAIAPFFLVPLIYLFGDWETPWNLVACLGFVWCAAFWFWFRNRPEDMPQVNAAEKILIQAGRAGGTASHSNVPWKKLLGSRSVWALCLMYGFGGFTASFYVTLLPAYLKDQRGLNDNEMKWLSGLPLACGVVACVAGGVISDSIIRRTGNRRWGRRITGLVGHACAGFALLATNWVQDTWALAALLSAAFFCNDLAMGPAWAACADIGERYAGTLGGAMNMVGNLAAALGSVIAGNLFDKNMASLAFIIFACSFWLASLCWFGVDATKPISALPDSA